MKSLTYHLSLEVINKNLKNTLFFLLMLDKLPTSIFISKKVLKKINIISPNLFLHHPLFLMSFQTEKELISAWETLKSSKNKKIEYINFKYLKLHKTINVFYLFNHINIFKNLTFFLKQFNSLFYFLKSLKT